MRKLFVSTPWNGRSVEEVQKEMQVILEHINRTEEEEHILINSIINCKGQNALWCLGTSINRLSEADTIYLVPGWKNARGCVIEYECALQYGIEHIIYGNEKDLLPASTTDKTKILYVSIPWKDREYSEAVSEVKNIHKSVCACMNEDYDLRFTIESTDILKGVEQGFHNIEKADVVCFGRNWESDSICLLEHRGALTFSKPVMLYSDILRVTEKDSRVFKEIQELVFNEVLQDEKVKKVCDILLKERQKNLQKNAQGILDRLEKRFWKSLRK